MTSPRTKKLTEAWLSGVLAQLGHNPGEVAAALRIAGIRGEPHDPGDCPIAQYIKKRARELAPAARVTASVAAGNATVGIEFPGSGYRWVCVPPSGPVREFIWAFDTDAYPGLLGEPPA